MYIHQSLLLYSSSTCWLVEAGDSSVPAYFLHASLLQLYDLAEKPAFVNFA